MYKEFIEELLLELEKENQKLSEYDLNILEDDHHILVLSNDFEFIVIRKVDIQTDLACITITGTEAEKPARYMPILERILRTKFEF